MTVTKEIHCFHCTQPILSRVPFVAVIRDKEEPMCCAGCKAVAEMINEAGLLSYYDFRTTAAIRPDSVSDLVPEELRQELNFYDHPDIAKQFVFTSDKGEGAVQEANLIVDNIVCAACVWLLEHRVQSIKGVASFNINYSTHRAYLAFNSAEVKISTILIEILKLGYEATPYDEQVQQKQLKKARRSLLLAFGIAALFSMQVMTFSIALYFGDYEGMNDLSRIILRWMSLVMAIPCVTYCSYSFYKAAFYDLKNKHLTMNVNVSLAIILGTLASTWNTLFNVGEIYFESVTMFAFLLLGARLLEMNARHKALLISDHVLKLKPHFAERINEDNTSEFIAVSQINVGDMLRVKPGESIPTDGVLFQNRAWVDESLLTGESLPLEKREGDELIGGAINHEQALLMKATKIGAETVFAQMSMMIDRAMGEKPKMIKLADIVSTWFVLILLAACVVTYFIWLNIDSARAFPIMLAVLVVSCPCALALATPAAISSGNQAIIEKGLIGTRAGALEALSQITDIVFDKTGTLTEGNLTLSKTLVMENSGYSEAELLQIACSLEAFSNHPIASGFKKIKLDKAIELLEVEDALHILGKGIEGTIDGEAYKIGRVDWFKDDNVIDLDEGIWIALGKGETIYALFGLLDQLKKDAKSVVEDLKSSGYSLHILSGDRSETVDYLNQTLGIDHAFGDQIPEDKLNYVSNLQKSGKIVAMLGDGINDAPVLAKANVSIAIGQGALLAQATADMILLRAHDLTPLVQGIKLAKKTNAIVIQNLGWALLYNIIALPVAMMGFILPWMAALGMSMSSLIVIGNTLRIRDSE